MHIKAVRENILLLFLWFFPSNAVKKIYITHLKNNNRYELFMINEIHYKIYSGIRPSWLVFYVFEGGLHQA